MGANNGFDAARFAALWASFDTGNPSEAEAMNAARSLRRMVAGYKLRVVDCVTGRDDVIRALDAQMKPVRLPVASNRAELKAARERVEKLGAENLDLMRKVRELAGTLKAERESSAAREIEFEAYRRQVAENYQRRSSAPPRASSVPTRPVSQSWSVPKPAPVDWHFLKGIGFMVLAMLVLIGAAELVGAVVDALSH